MSQEVGTEVEFTHRMSPESSRRDGRPVHEFLRRRDLEYSMSQSQLTAPASQQGMTEEAEDGSKDSGDENGVEDDIYEMQQGENWIEYVRLVFVFLVFNFFMSLMYYPCLLILNKAW